MEIERLIHPSTQLLPQQQLPTPPPDDYYTARMSAPELPVDMAIDTPEQTEPASQTDQPDQSSQSSQPEQEQSEQAESPETSIASSTVAGVEDFHLLQILGTGTFSRVWLVMPRQDESAPEPSLYALKQLRKADVIRLKQVEHIRNEKNILELCQSHPFVPAFLCAWQDRSSLYFLLEYSPGGELFGYLRRARRFDYPVARFYAAEITLILVFLHNHGVVYRDLKPENVLLDARGHIKLVDFGFAKIIGDRETYTLCGTPEYLSPEVIQSKGHGKAVDWWALGVLIYEMILGYPPFYDNSPIQIYEKIVAGRISFPAWLPHDVRDIIQQLCTKDLSSRLGNMRGGGFEVMAHPFFSGIDWVELETQRNEGPLVPKLHFSGDTSYFENYEPEMPRADDDYPESMRREYDHLFRDF